MFVVLMFCWSSAVVGFMVGRALPPDPYEKRPKVVEVRRQAPETPAMRTGSF
jgi:hypothetical protein